MVEHDSEEEVLGLVVGGDGGRVDGGGLMVGGPMIVDTLVMVDHVGHDV